MSPEVFVITSKPTHGVAPHVLRTKQLEIPRCVELVGGLRAMLCRSFAEQALLPCAFLHAVLGMYLLSLRHGRCGDRMPGRSWRVQNRQLRSDVSAKVRCAPKCASLRGKRPCALLEVKDPKQMSCAEVLGIARQ